MSMNGADIDRLRTLAKKFNIEAAHLEALINRLQSTTPGLVDEQVTCFQHLVTARPAM